MGQPQISSNEGKNGWERRKNKGEVGQGWGNQARLECGCPHRPQLTPHFTWLPPLILQGTQADVLGGRLRCVFTSCFRKLGSPHI